jgi:DNA-binding beta-propeller fold protein YncE
VQDGTWVLQNCTSGCQAGIPGDGIGQLDNPHALAVDSQGNLYVTDSENGRIVKFDVDGNFQSQWGSWCDTNESGYDGCDGMFGHAWGIAVDSSGHVYVADANNYRIQVFEGDGTFITKWGTRGIDGSGPGRFDQPVYVAVDGAGSVFVADNGNDQIQKFTLADPCPAGTSQVEDFDKGNLVSIEGVCFVKEWGSTGTADGEFAGPSGMALDKRGNLYVADYDPHSFESNERIQKFDGEGNFITKWGAHCSVNASGLDGCDGDFWKPSAVAVDGLGSVYVLEVYNNRIQKFGFTTEQRIESLAWDIEELAAAGYLDYGNANALTAKLENALESFEKGNGIPAMNTISAFINQVYALMNAGKLTPEQAAELVTAAQLIIDQMLEG